MQAIAGRKSEELTREQLHARAARYDGVTIDLGAGDGKFAYRYARRHPERFIIAIDPVAENLREESARAAKKPERGGAPNALFVVASVERMPAELAGLADEVYVTLPWGSLMRGLILGEAVVLDGVASIGKPGAAIRIVLNTRIFDEPVPLDARDLPELTPEYVRDALGERYGRHGVEITDVRWMAAEEVAALDTTWAKRLSHRSPPRSVYIEARRAG